METGYFLLLLLMLSVLCFTPNLASTKANFTTDELALLTIKDHITYDPHSILELNWSTAASFCSWVGVTCGTHHVRVTALSLSNMGLEGTIPPHVGNLSFLVSLDLSVNKFHGLLPQELGKLRRLKFIDLTKNSFSGGLPKEIGDCLNFNSIKLSDNQLSGIIPSAIFSLSSLQVLSLANNSLSGSLLDDMCKNLSNAEILTFSSNQFDGQLPPSLGECRKLQEIDLSYNKLTGEIPSNIGNLTNLKRIYLDNNNLNGPIPPTLFNIYSLELISLSNNTLSGILPSDMCHKFSMLKYLHISRTNLTGSIPKNIENCSFIEIELRENHLTGGIPNNIGNLTNLERFLLGDNYLKGEIPREIGNLRDLRMLHMDANKLSGQIPSVIFNFTNIIEIDLFDNHLSGSLPSDMGFWLPNLDWLNLWGNNLSGEIPSSISNASKLSTIDLHGNSFFGPIPIEFGNLRQLQLLRLRENNLTTGTSAEWDFLSSLNNCKRLRALDISSNPLNGNLPTNIGNLSTSLQEFYVDNCNIKGTIPLEIGNLSNLIKLSLYSNEFTGSIPITIGRLQRLQGLYSSENKLQGFIPDAICNLRSLSELYLDENKLSGPVPTSIGNLSSLRYLYLGFNKLFSSIPSSFWSLNDILEVNLASNLLNGSIPTDIQKLGVMILLDLSWNHLSGSIPITIGGLKSLASLSLDNNSLQGSIPDPLGDLLSLESLDLSNNNLSGVIPKSLEKLHFLKNFNVSFNKLKGEIPTEGPFKKFSAESFMWNSGLCGSVHLKVPLCKASSLKKSKCTTACVLKYILPLGAATILILVLIVVTKRCLKGKANSTVGEILLANVTWRRVSYLELFNATDGFNENMLLGIGSFGSVYKGNLSDGLIVAIKVFKLQADRGFRSFEIECEVMKNIRHRNLVQIITSCSGTEFKALILQFMSNGSLEKWLHSNNYFLDIQLRINIMIDVASALDYLHHGSTQPVVHCDLKPNNVLLDEDMVAHVGDFGIAKLLGKDDCTTQTITLASIGYMAPEFGSEGIVSTKCDVYSYGILLMEVFTGKKPTDSMFTGEMSLKSWVNQSIPHAIIEVVDSNLFGTNEERFIAKKDCILSILELAMDCCAELPEQRITMGDVHATLKKIKMKYLRDSGVRPAQENGRRD